MTLIGGAQAVGLAHQRVRAVGFRNNMASYVASYMAIYREEDSVLKMSQLLDQNVPAIRVEGIQPDLTAEVDEPVVDKNVDVEAGAVENVVVKEVAVENVVVENVTVENFTIENVIKNAPPIAFRLAAKPSPHPGPALDALLEPIKPPNARPEDLMGGNSPPPLQVQDPAQELEVVIEQPHILATLEGDIERIINIYNK